MTINSFVTSTPHKESFSSFFNQTNIMNDTVVMKPNTTTTKRGKIKSNSRLAEFSDEDDLNRTPAVNTRSKQESRKAGQKNPTNETLNVRTPF